MAGSIEDKMRATSSLALDKDDLQVQRLELLGLDHKNGRQSKANVHKNLDQMQDRDLFTSQNQSTHAINRYKQQRA